MEPSGGKIILMADISSEFKVKILFIVAVGNAVKDSRPNSGLVQLNRVNVSLFLGSHMNGRSL